MRSRSRHLLQRSPSDRLDVLVNPDQIICVRPLGKICWFTANFGLKIISLKTGISLPAPPEYLVYKMENKTRKLYCKITFMYFFTSK